MRPRDAAEPTEREYLEGLRYEDRLNAMAEADPSGNGLCGHCQRFVMNETDLDHRITPILQGGRGVECKLRGDFLGRHTQVGHAVVACPGCGEQRWYGYGPCSKCGAEGPAR